MESELERLRKKVENFPSASAYNRLAELMRLGGDPTGAEQACRRCIKEFPRNGQAYVILAEIELSGGKRDDAIKNLLIAVERDQRSYAAHRMLAEHYASSGKPGQALQHLRHILSFKANDPLVLQKIEQLSGKPATRAVTRSPLAHASPSLEAGPIPMPARTDPAPFTAKAASGDGLAALCRETGVRGALIADDKGQVVASGGLSRDQETLLAAFAQEICTAAGQGLKLMGQERLSLWMVAGTQGQVLGFKRDVSLSVVVLAEPGVRPAMLEIRARQALIDLGAA